MREEERIKEVLTALEKREFIPYFQPQYNYLQKKISGVEVLARWKHPQKGILSPGDFIPVLEEYEKVSELDYQVMEAAVRQIAVWQREGIELPSFSFNLSRVTMLDPNLVAVILGILEKNKISPSMIHLEITESFYALRLEAMLKVISNLKQYGFRIEMDDFGTGYSSLSLLRDANMDVLKMDMSFLQITSNRAKGGSIISSVIRLAESLEMDVIAEGVETAEQAEFLKSVGCCYMQGYLFSRPLPSEEMYLKLTDTSLEQKAVREYPGASQSMDFLDDTTQSALLMNCSVGGSCIAEGKGDSWYLIRVNDRFFTELGLSEAEYPLAWLNTHRFFTGEHQERFTEMLNSAEETGKVTECETQFDENLIGQKLWLHMRARFLTKRAASSVYYIDIENITRRKLVELEREKLQQELRLSNRELKSAMTFVPGGNVVYEILQDGNIGLESISEEAAGVCGCTPDRYRTAFENNYLERIYSGDVEKLNQAIKELVSGKTELDLIYRLYHSDGNLIWGRLRGHVERGADNRRFLYGFFTDLSVTSSLYQHLLNETDTAVVVTDLETHEILFANEKAAAIGSTDLESVIGKRCYECLNRCSEVNEKCIMEIPPDGLEILEERSGKSYRVRRKRIDWNGIDAAVCYIAAKPEKKLNIRGVVSEPQEEAAEEEERQTKQKARVKQVQEMTSQFEGWKNILTILRNNHEGFKSLLTDDAIRIRIQFFAIYLILGTVAVGMTVLNIVTHWEFLAWTTGIFALLSYADAAIGLISEKLEQTAQQLFAFEIIALFTVFAMFGEPEGFSVLWSVLLPTCGLLLYKARKGIFLVGVQLLIFIILFRLPFGKQLLNYGYTPTFMQRFPILFLALLSIGFFFEFIRDNTQKELISTRERFEYMYNHDALTGLYNRYGFNQTTEKLEDHKNAKELAFAICDLDGFKSVNDKYGHMNGDLVLKGTAQIILGCVGDAGIVCRWGGEEFSILFLKQEMASEICENILRECRRKEYVFGEFIVHETISIGMVKIDTLTRENSSEVITAADANLYRAKTTGKNKLVESKLIMEKS